MSFTVGGIDLANSAINAELRILVLEKIVEKLIQYAPPEDFSHEDIVRFRKESLEELQKKYPKAGITGSPDITKP